MPTLSEFLVHDVQVVVRDSGTTDCVSCGTSSYDVWPQWNYAYTTTSATTVIDSTWTAWSTAVSYQGFTSPVHTVRTPAEIEADRVRVVAEQAALKAARLEQERATKAANDRAEALLQENLSAEQRKDLAKHRFFTVIAQDGKRRYRINRGRQGNVELVDSQGNSIHKYCIHPTELIPDADTMLAQKLMIEHDEKRFLVVANVS